MKQLKRKGGVHAKGPTKKRRVSQSTRSIQEDIKLDPHDLSSEFVKQPSLLLHYSRLFAKAAAETRECKFKLEVKEAELSARIKERLERGGNRATERAIDIDLKSSVEWQSAKVALNDAQYQEALLRAAVDSLIHKRDMLIQLGSKERAEMNANIVLMEEETNKRLKPVS